MNERALRELLRAHRGFIRSVVIHDMALAAAGTVYTLSGARDLHVTVSSGVFAAIVILVLATMQVEVIRRAAPDLRNVLLLPVRRETLLAIFYAGFALPGAVLLLAAGGLAMLAAGAAAPGEVTGAPGRLGSALLAYLVMKSLVVNLAVAIRWSVLAVGMYLVLLAASYVLIVAVADFTGAPHPLPAGVVMATLVLVNMAFAAGATRELDS